MVDNNLSNPWEHRIEDEFGDCQSGAYTCNTRPGQIRVDYSKRAQRIEGAQVHLPTVGDKTPDFRAAIEALRTLPDAELSGMIISNLEERLSQDDTRPRPPRNILKLLGTFGREGSKGDETTLAARLDSESVHDTNPKGKQTREDIYRLIDKDSLSASIYEEVISTGNPKQKVHGPRVIKKLLKEAEGYIAAAGQLMDDESRTNHDYIYALRALNLAIEAYEVAAFNPEFREAAEEQLSTLKTARINMEGDWRDDMRYGTMRTERTFFDRAFDSFLLTRERMVTILDEETGTAIGRKRFDYAIWLSRKKKRIEEIYTGRTK